MRGAMLDGLQRLGRVQEVGEDTASPEALTGTEEDLNTYIVASTGARVFLHSAVQMLNNLCATMHSDR